MSNEIIYLGYPFLKKYDIILEQDKRIAGFYNFQNNFDDKEKEKKKGDSKEEKINPNFDKKNNNTKYIVLILFLIIMIILYLKIFNN